MATDNPRHSVSVAAAIVDDGQRVLVIRRRDNGKWEPPGGVLEVNETFHEGLIREVREETGLIVEPLALTGVYKNMCQTIVALVFRCKPVGGAVHPTHEVLETRWMTAQQIKIHMGRAYACRLLDATDDGPPAVRVHDGVSLMKEPRTTD